MGFGAAAALAPVRPLVAPRQEPARVRILTLQRHQDRAHRFDEGDVPIFLILRRPARLHPEMQDVFRLIDISRLQVPGFVDPEAALVHGQEGRVVVGRE